MQRDRLVDQNLRYSAALTTIAFILHYAWENVQCPQFVHRQGDTTMWLAMVWATSGDVALTWVTQLAFAAISGSWIWPRGARRRFWLLLPAAAAIMAVAVERYALATGRWSYAETNPQIPGLGVSLLPVAQLIILLPMSFLAADRLAGTTLTRRGHAM